MLFTVRELIEQRGEPVAARLDDPVQHALETMIQFDFSQLPVVDEAQDAKYMVSSDSILRALDYFGTSLPGLRVRDIEQMLRDLILAGLGATDADLDGDVVRAAIEEITPSNEEQKRQFRKALAHYLKRQTSDPTPQPNEEWVKEAFQVAFPDRPRAKRFNDLTLYEFSQLFLQERHWARYGGALTLDRESVRNALDAVRETRNDLFHISGGADAQTASAASLLPRMARAPASARSRAGGCRARADGRDGRQGPPTSSGPGPGGRGGGSAGQIDAEPPELEAAQAWAVGALNRLATALRPRLAEAAGSIG